jgi:hypothetical protein
MTVIDSLNSTHGSKLDSQLDPVLGETPDNEIGISGPLTTGPYHETRKWFAAQIEVQRAVKLLGKAPLAPHVRAALFDRLSEESHVTAVGPARDRRGRAGTRITFEWMLDESIPKFTVTSEELRADAEAKSQPHDGPIAGPDHVDVPKHRSIGRWYESIIIDQRTGSILEDEGFATWKTTVPVPRVGTTTRRIPVGTGWNLGIRFDPGTYGGGGGTLFDVRERTTSIAHPLTAACAITPRMCR